MTEVQFIELIGTYVRWFLKGRKGPLKDYLKDEINHSITSNLLVGITAFITLLIILTFTLSRF